jgi:arylsulfatase A-like enzyme
MPRFITLALIVFAFAAPVYAQPAGKATKPNILFIMADDLGYGDLGCYGQKDIKTPNIDRLAKDGTRFTHAYCGASVCSPSRCVLVTGMHTGHGRIRGNSHPGFKAKSDQPVQTGRVPLRDEDVTFAEILRMAGYATGLVGKWGLGEPGTSGEPNKQGFDEWFGYLNNDHCDDYFPDFLWHNGKKHPLPGNQGKTKTQYSTDLFSAKALDFIQKNKDRPFFLYLAYTAPHARYEVPDLGDYANTDWSEKEKIYAAMISRMDKGVGQILDLLDELKLSDNTIVFFTSDNGASSAVVGWRFGSTAGFRGRKGTLDEGGVRVPMLVRWPGHVPAGRTDETPWYFADVLPTFADLGGLKTPVKSDGVSMKATLLGHKQDMSQRFLYWEQGKGQIAVRMGDWKFHQGKLFYLPTDPHEDRNVAAAQPQLMHLFQEYLKTARTKWEP